MKITPNHLFYYRQLHYLYLQHAAPIKHAHSPHAILRFAGVNVMFLLNYTEGRELPRADTHTPYYIVDNSAILIIPHLHTHTYNHF